MQTRAAHADYSQAENSRLIANKNNAFASVAMAAVTGSGARGPWWRWPISSATALCSGNGFPTSPKVAVVEPEGTFLMSIVFRALGLSSDDLTAVLRPRAGRAMTRGFALGAEGAGSERLNIACQRTRPDAALNGLRHAVESRREDAP